MLIPKVNGREVLLQRIRSRFAVDGKPTLAQTVQVLEESISTDRIEHTSYSLVIEAWPMGPIFQRYVDVALAIGLCEDDDDWEELPSTITINFVSNPSILTHLTRRFHGFLDSDEIGEAKHFFDRFRNSAIFAIFDDRSPCDFSVSLSSEDDTLEMMSKLLPAMKKAGIVQCCNGDTCTTSS